MNTGYTHAHTCTHIHAGTSHRNPFTANRLDRTEEKGLHLKRSLGQLLTTDSRIRKTENRKGKLRLKRTEWEA